MRSLTEYESFLKWYRIVLSEEEVEDTRVRTIRKSDIRGAMQQERCYIEHLTENFLDELEITYRSKLEDKRLLEELARE